jgi:hypothetical protein
MLHLTCLLPVGQPVGKVKFGVEAAEKVPKQILGRDVEKSDLIECATINDLMLGKGQGPTRTAP